MTNTAAEAEATLDQFLALFNAGTDVEGIVALFAPDAPFWGTTLGEFGASTDIIRNYFTGAFGRRDGATVAARITDHATRLLSDDVVAVLGRWQIDRSDRVSLLRFSIVLQRTDGRWLIAQFHSSPRPG